MIVAQIRCKINSDLRMTTPKPKPSLSERAEHARGLLDELNTDLLDPLKARETFLEDHNIQPGSFRAEVLNGVADSMMEDPTLDAGELYENVDANVDKSELDWGSGQDVADYVKFNVLGWAFSLVEGTVLEGLVEKLIGPVSSVIEKKEAFMSALNDPVSVLENLEDKMARAEGVGIHFQDDNMNVEALGKLRLFIAGSEELTDDYKALDPTDSAELAEWWQKAFEMYNQKAEDKIKFDTEALVGVLTGTVLWKDLLLGDDIDRLRSRVEEEGESSETVAESGDYGPMVPLEESEVGAAGLSSFAEIQGYIDDNASAIAMLGMATVPGTSALTALVGLSPEILRNPDSGAYLSLANLPTDEASNLPMSELFETMALFESLSEDGEPFEIPKEAEQFKRFLRDKAEASSGQYAHLVASEEKLDQIARMFTGEIPDVRDQIVNNVKESLDGLFSLALAWLSLDEQEFLEYTNQRGISRLSNLIRKRILSSNVEKVKTITDQLLPQFSRSENITFVKLDEVLNPALEEIGLRLALKDGYIWLQEKQTGSENWKVLDKLMVDTSHEDAENLARNLTEADSFATAIPEGMVETARAWFGDLEQFKKSIESGETAAAIQEGVGIVLFDPVNVAVKRVIPYQYLSVVFELFEGEEGTFWEDLGVTVGGTMLPFTVLRSPTLYRQMRSKNLWGTLITTGRIFRDALWAPGAAVDAVTADGRKRIGMKYRLWRQMAKHQGERFRFGRPLSGVDSDLWKRFRDYRIMQFELRQLEIIETRGWSEKVPRNLRAAHSNYLNEAAKIHYDRLQKLAVEHKVPLPDIKFERAGGNTAVINKISSAVRREFVGVSKEILETNLGIDRNRARIERRGAPETPEKDRSSWRRFGETFRSGGSRRWGKILGLVGLASAPAAAQAVENESSVETSSGGSETKTSTEIDRPASESQLAPEALRSELAEFDEAYTEVMDLVEPDHIKNTTNAQALSALEDLRDSGAHTQNIERLKAHVEAHRDQYYDLVMAEPDQVLRTDSPFFELKIENGKLRLDYAEYDDMETGYFKSMDYLQDYPDGMTIGDTLWSFGGEFVPYVRTTRSYDRATDAWQRGQYLSAAGNGMFFGLDLLSDGLFTAGLATSATGIGVVVGGPMMAIGGGIRLVTGSAKAVARGLNHLSKTRTIKTAHAASTAVEVGVIAKDLLIEHVPLSNTHTF